MINFEKYCRLFANVSIFCFFTLLLVFPKGYNYGSTVLLVVSVLFLLYTIYKKINITGFVKQNKSIFIAISFYFLTFLSLSLVKFTSPKTSLMRFCPQ